MSKTITFLLTPLLLLTFVGCTKSLEEKMDSANSEVKKTNVSLDEVNRGIRETNERTKQLEINQRLQTAYLAANNPAIGEKARVGAAVYFIREAGDVEVVALVGTALPISKSNFPDDPLMGPLRNEPNVTLVAEEDLGLNAPAVVNAKHFGILFKASDTLVKMLIPEAPAYPYGKEKWMKDAKRAIHVATSVYGGIELVKLPPPEAALTSDLVSGKPPEVGFKLGKKQVDKEKISTKNELEALQKLADSAPEPAQRTELSNLVTSLVEERRLK